MNLPHDFGNILQEDHKDIQIFIREFVNHEQVRVYETTYQRDISRLPTPILYHIDIHVPHALSDEASTANNTFADDQDTSDDSTTTSSATYSIISTPNDYIGDDEYSEYSYEDDDESTTASDELPVAPEIVTSANSSTVSDIEYSYQAILEAITKAAQLPEYHIETLVALLPAGNHTRNTESEYTESDRANINTQAKRQKLGHLNIDTETCIV